MAVNKKKNKKITKKNYKIIIFTIIPIVLSSFLVYLIIPKITLNGTTYQTINYKDNYQEPGYKATMFFKNITPLVEVDSNLKNNIVGSYNITYNLHYKFLTISKKRTVIVIIIFLQK